MRSNGFGNKYTAYVTRGVLICKHILEVCNKTLTRPKKQNRFKKKIPGMYIYVHSNYMCKCNGWATMKI